MKSAHWFALWLFPALLSVPLAGLCDRICIEAESADNIAEPMIRVEGAAGDQDAVKGASGGAYLEIPEGRGNPPKVNAGSATFRFKLAEDADLVLWCRVWWNGECSNSFAMQVDDSVPFTFGQDGTYHAWHWVKAPPNIKCLKLARGEHTLTVSNREDGVRLDQILLITDKKYVPVDVEAPSQPRAGQ